MKVKWCELAPVKCTKSLRDGCAFNKCFLHTRVNRIAKRAKVYLLIVCLWTSGAARTCCVCVFKHNSSRKFQRKTPNTNFSININWRNKNKNNRNNLIENCAAAAVALFVIGAKIGHGWSTTRQQDFDDCSWNANEIVNTLPFRMRICDGKLLFIIYDETLCQYDEHRTNILLTAE